MVSFSTPPSLKLFYDLAHKLNASLDLDAVLGQVIAQVNHFLKIDATSVSLLDAESKELVIRMTIGSETDPQPGLRLPPYAGIAGWVVRHKEPVLLADVQQDPRFYPSVDQRTHFTSRSMICVPLIVQNEPIGVIQAISSSSGAFSNADYYFMIALADVAALHIENARLYKAEREARQYAELLKQVAETVGSSLGLENVLDRALEKLHQVVSCDRAAILVLDGYYPQRLPWYASPGGVVDLQRSEHLIVLAGYGFDDLDAVLKMVVPAQRIPLLEQIRFSKYAVTVADTHLDSRYVRWAADDRVRSWLGVPLIADGQVMGLISVDRHTVNEFTPQEIDFTVAFGQQIASALVNARLYREACERADELAILNEIFLAVGTSLDLEIILDRVLDVIMALFALDAVAVLMLTVAGDRLDLEKKRGFSPALAHSIQELAVDDGLIWNNVIGSHKTVVVECDGVGDQQGAEEHAGTGSNACVWVPLLANGKVMGALVMHNSDQHRFSVQYLSFLEAVGRYIGIAVNNAREVC